MLKMNTHSVIESSSVDNHEVFQAVLVGRVVAVPCHHVERGVVLGTVGVT